MLWQVWLMDSEGFFGPGVSEDYDAKIFTLATLLGSYLVYNTIKIIDQQVGGAFFRARTSRPDRPTGVCYAHRCSWIDFSSVEC